MLTIGQVAHLAGTTVRAVRHYHQTGLLPEPPRGSNGYRRYRGSDLSRLLQIRQLGDLGLALADIRRLVDGSASDRREALKMLHDQYADQERQLADRRARIAELLAIEGDPAIPTRMRGTVRNLTRTGAPEHLIAVDAEIFRALGRLIPPDQQRSLEDAMAEMAHDRDMVATIGAYMGRLDEVAALPSDHSDVRVLAQDFADFLQSNLPNLTDADNPESRPDVEWLVQDLLSERLAPTQVAVLRDVIEHLRAAAGAEAGARDPTPPS